MGERIRLSQEKRGARVNHKTVGLNKTKSQSDQSPVDRILNLQKTIGNQAVTRLIRTGVIQASLNIGQPGDIYEREADRVADQVMRMRMPETGCPECEEQVEGVQRQVEEEEEEKIQTKPLAEQITPLVQRQAVPEEEEESVQAKLRNESLLQRQVEEEEEEPIQAKLMDNRQLQRQEEEDIESRIQSMKNGGQPLSESTRAFFEPRFGTDFSQVRVHTGSRAGETARAINAKAYTMGNHIVFARNQYAPNTVQGKRLMAHELTHVIQQKGSTALRIQAQNANECTYGEIRSWAIVSQSDHAAPAGLADAKASIGAVCARGNPCACVDGSGATAPGDQAAWRNIVAATGGADQTGGGNFMCVGTQNCWFVHSCYECHNGSRRLVRRPANLAASGSCTVTGKGTLYFYNDTLRGWCNRADYTSGCRTP